MAMVAVTAGRVTMVGIARWADKGGGYRTTQRFFATVSVGHPVLGIL